MIFPAHSPFCSHFASCGGCSLQDKTEDDYTHFKKQAVRQALLEKKILTTETPFRFIDAHGAGRRRIVLHARWSDGAVQVGFMAKKSHTLVSIAACPVTVPVLQNMAPQIADLLQQSLTQKRRFVDIHLTALDTGVLCAFKGEVSCSSQEIQNLIQYSQSLGFCSLFWNGELLAQWSPALLTLGSATLSPPPHAFLQATTLGETLLTTFAKNCLSHAQKIADLFCGLGPFALNLAERSEISAYDIEGPSLEALRAAHKKAGLKKISVIRRDLFHLPLSAAELSAFDAIVLDPPAKGAYTQIQRLAESSVPDVVLVSCNLNTFLRDSLVLLTSGYSLEKMIAIDQFKWTSHIELAAWFRRLPDPRIKASQKQKDG